MELFSKADNIIVMEHIHTYIHTYIHTHTHTPVSESLQTQQVELFSKADNIIVMEHGKFEYYGSYNTQALRKLFPNAHFAEGPGGSQQPPNMRSSNPHMPGRMAQTEVLSFGSNNPPGLALSQVFLIVSRFQLFCLVHMCSW